MAKYVFITGGVVSSLGKGIVAGSLAAILESRGLNVTIIKFDPYLNVDPGTMSPYQHGEVFVTDDGAETDLDLGHYERFIKSKMTKQNNVTSGQIYESVIAREREGGYLGATVQVIPHVTDEIKQRITNIKGEFDIVLIEIGGTVGDIESLPFLEAIRQFRLEQDLDSTVSIHLTLVPYIATAGEVKTKPTQHSVKELRSIGIQPDILICRSEHPLSNSDLNKISLFSNVSEQAVIGCEDMPSIFEVPVLLHNQNLDNIVLQRLNIKANPAELSSWQDVVLKQKLPRDTVKIAMISKYTGLADAYKSVHEALIHAGIENRSKVIIEYVDAEMLQDNQHILSSYHAILVPGGFGERGIDGKILATKYARENNIPFFGICLGLQVAVIEFSRSILNLVDANSTEFDQQTKNPVIALVTEWQTDTGDIEKRSRESQYGGTMRLGAKKCILQEDSKAAQMYQQDCIFERHRHRYEVNAKYCSALHEAGLAITGRSVDNLVEIIELPEHRWFLACQFHPEFTSNPRGGHPLFNGFIKSALDVKHGE